jgi:hypothetical protein
MLHRVWPRLLLKCQKRRKRKHGLTDERVPNLQCWAQAIHRAALHSPAYTLPENLLQVLLAVSDGRGDDAAAMAIKISGLKEDFSENTFRQRVSGLVRCKILQA